MRITDGILFLGFAVFLDSIELSSGMSPKPKDSMGNVEKRNENANRQGMSSGIPPRRATYLHDVATSSGHANHEELRSPPLRTLEELFRGYNGVLPRMQQIPNKNTVNFHNFRQLGDRKMVDPEPRFFAIRDYVIIGWVNEGIIAPLSSCFHTSDVFVVFDMIEDQWYTLHREEFQKLGIGRHIQLIHARDKVANSHRQTSNGQIDLQAHLVACEHANREADRIENEPDERIPRIYRDVMDEFLSDFGHRERAVRTGYSDAYRSATDTYKNTHGPNQVDM